MIFRFLTYIRPTWYFNLIPKKGCHVFPQVDLLDQAIKDQLIYDANYISKTSSNRDLSWQAFQKGFVNTKASLEFKEVVPVVDEYRFVRKYHKPIWAIYCLLIRLLTFHNPIKEFKAWYKTRNVFYINIFENPIQETTWKIFKSSLLASQPKVSVIIPTLNRYPYLKDVLSDLEKQEYKNFEVIVMDQSEPFQKEFFEQFDLELKVHFQKEKALWLARNTAIKVSDADYFLLFDDDSRVEKDWISNHIKGLDFYNAAISSGQSISKPKELLPQNYRYFRVSDLLDTGNVLIKKKVFETIGLFDNQFEKQRMGDGEYGLRAYLNGFVNISNPYATRLHLKVGTGGLRQIGSWDAFRPKKMLSPRPIPSVLYLYRSYFGNKLSKYALLKTLPSSIIPYKFKKNKKILIFGVLISILLLPILLLQVFRSWRLASIKIKQGALIEKFK
jgi:glycosyltransferase involved in cell wall biosynthesis